MHDLDDMRLPLRVSSFDPDLVDNHLEWVSRVIRAASQALTEDEAIDLTFVVAPGADEEYIQIMFEPELAEDEEIGSFIRAQVSALDPIAALTLLESSGAHGPSLLVVLETPDDVRVRAYKLDVWESGQRRLGERYDWTPEENSDIPAFLERRTLH